MAAQVRSDDDDSDLVTVAAMIEPREPSDGDSAPSTLEVTPESIEFLRGRGFSLDKAIDQQGTLYEHYAHYIQEAASLTDVPLVLVA